MTEAIIYDHVRTPRGRGTPAGGLHEVTPVSLAAQPLRALTERCGLAAGTVDEIILGVATGAGEQGPTLTRVAGLLAGYPDSTPGLQLSQSGASGLEAVAVAAAKVAAGSCDLVVAGGVESMSRVPAGADGGGPWGPDPELTSRFPFMLEGVAADLVATLLGFSRADLDTYGLASQRRATGAWDKGYFDRSVIAVVDYLGEVLLMRDEHVTPQATAESLTALAPAFAAAGEGGGFDAVAIAKYPQIAAVRHLHTAATSSGAADGAGAVLVGSAQAGERLGLAPRARIISTASVGSEPTAYLGGPAGACRKALARAGLAAADVDLWEADESFAVVPLQLMAELSVHHDRLNVNGGAIALGHPRGATGAMMLGTLLDELERRGLPVGVAVLCATAGVGTAMVIERT